jgi:hypothetical protein
MRLLDIVTVDEMLLGMAVSTAGVLALLAYSRPKQPPSDVYSFQPGIPQRRMPALGRS